MILLFPLLTLFSLIFSLFPSLTNTAELKGLFDLITIFSPLIFISFLTSLGIISKASLALGLFSAFFSSILSTKLFSSLEYCEGNPFGTPLTILFPKTIKFPPVNGGSKQAK